MSSFSGSPMPEAEVFIFVGPDGKAEVSLYTGGKRLEGVRFVTNDKELADRLRKMPQKMLDALK